MKIEIPQTLIELSNIFKENGSPLYLVGGFVRNALLGFVETDMDICGPLRYDKVKKMLSNSIFSVKIINQNLGTLLIKSKISEEEFEYTTWRKESYNSGGEHSPNNVVFVTDMKTDALRRDFTCNCLYYDIANDEIIDLHDGIRDTKEHILKTVDSPSKTFNDDGLRLLRLVRMSAELDFDIDEDTYEIAKEKISQLQDISQERFNKEVISILFSDYKYDAVKNTYCPTKGINQLSDLEAWGYILRQITMEKGIDYVNSCLKSNWVKYLNITPVVHRVTMFAYEILKALRMEINLENVDKVLGQYGLMLSKKEVMLHSRLLMGYEYLKCLNENDMVFFIQQNSDIISRLLDFARIFNVGDNIRAKYKIMIIDKVPMNIKELAVNGYDIIQNCPNIPKHKYAEIFDDLLLQCGIMPEMNTKTKLISYIKGKYK